MIEHHEQVSYETLVYQRSAGTLKIHGILSIIFGGIGTLAGIVFTLLLIASTYADESYDSANSSVGLFVVSTMVFIFWTLPHVYLIISGYYLVREPAPKTAKILVIINLIVGVFWNLILLIMAIVNLTQLSDYEHGYPTHKKKQ